jgi:hypothetical protein
VKGRASRGPFFLRSASRCGPRTQSQRNAGKEGFAIPIVAVGAC